MPKYIYRRGCPGLTYHLFLKFLSCKPLIGLLDPLDRLRTKVFAFFKRKYVLTTNPTHNGRFLQHFQLVSQFLLFEVADKIDDCLVTHDANVEEYTGHKNSDHYPADGRPLVVIVKEVAEEEE